VSSSLAKLRADTPGIIKGFNALAEAATCDGALTRKTKELGPVHTIATHQR
jgi:alkylhydroperoxidase/carboxymuconolactone decarboxylase family protein YurZ